MKFSLLTGYQPGSVKTQTQDEEDIKQLISIMTDELEKIPCEPEMDGFYLSKAFMLKLNKVSHKFQLLA